MGSTVTLTPTDEERASRLAQADAFRPADTKGYARSISKQHAPSGGRSHISTLERDVKKTGELTVEVVRLEAASDSVEEMVKESGGDGAAQQPTTGGGG